MQLRELIQKFEETQKNKSEEEAIQIFKRLNVDFILERIRLSKKIDEIAELLEIIDLISQEHSSELLNRLSIDELELKFMESIDTIGCTYLLESIHTISEEKAENLINKISNEKIEELIYQTNEFWEKVKFLHTIKEISESKINEKDFESIFYAEHSIAKTIDDIYWLLYSTQNFSMEIALKILNEISIQTIIDKIYLEKNVESIAALIEIIHKISNKVANELIDKSEAILIEKMKSGKEIGDITDILAVVNDISNKKARFLLEKVSNDFLVERIKVIYIRGISLLLEVVFRISNEKSENLLRGAGLELIKERIKSSQNRPAIIELLETIEKISEPFFSKLTKIIDINEYQYNKRISDN